MKSAVYRDGRLWNKCTPQ